MICDSYIQTYYYIHKNILLQCTLQPYLNIDRPKAMSVHCKISKACQHGREADSRNNAKTSLKHLKIVIVFMHTPLHIDSLKCCGNNLFVNCFLRLWIQHSGLKMAYIRIYNISFTEAISNNFLQTAIFLIVLHTLVSVGLTK